MAEDIRQDKKANFSALTEHNNNGVTRTSGLASNKTGASKKLVIKNFKDRPNTTLKNFTRRWRICVRIKSPPRCTSSFAKSVRTTSRPRYTSSENIL
ncbi:hypothetical protein UPYG_G00017250 [Umbra pygmaea]|uniref:Uncharacterized protein n=1 Tax=Umbra pygmaea TaxID=75934 RepID=A0ABD0XK29_UMBPY